jgi:hypothetical protein
MAMLGSMRQTKAFASWQRSKKGRRKDGDSTVSI